MNKALLIKLFAALLIIGFIVELLIVYTYVPQQSSAPQQNAPLPVEEDYVSAGLLPFSIRSFTGSLLFQCNASASSLPEFPGLLGKPVQIGSSQDGNLFLARSNASVNVSIVEYAGALFSACGDVVVYREALMVFNATNADMFNVVSQNVTKVFKRQFDAYTDRYGRGPIGLVSDADAVEGSVVEVRALAKLVGSDITAGSLSLEQPIVDLNQETVLNLDAVVVGFTDRRIAVISLPWEQRFSTPVLNAVFSENPYVLNYVVLKNAVESNLTFNSSFVQDVAVNESDLVLQVGNLTDKQTVLTALANFSNDSIIFPLSQYIVTFNASVEQPALQAVFVNEAVVSPLESSAQNITLPANFTALVSFEASLNQTVPILAVVRTLKGRVTGIHSRQVGVNLPE